MATRPVHFPRLVRRKKYSDYKRYKDFRQEIREDCLQRCAYCDAHELEIGSEKNFTLDHFRPRSYPEYKKLENDPYNLIWACRRCNDLKRDDWPAYGTEGTVNGKEGYVDPFQVDRKDYFELHKDGSLRPLRYPARYMIEVLELNRYFLRFIRQRRDAIYRGLSNLEQHFEIEIGTLLKIRAEALLSDLELAHLDQEIVNLKQLKESIELLDAMLKLPLRG